MTKVGTTHKSWVHAENIPIDSMEGWGQECRIHANWRKNAGENFNFFGDKKPRETNTKSRDNTVGEIFTSGTRDMCKGGY